MPERRNAVDLLTREILGLPLGCLNGITGELWPEYGVSMETWDETHEKADAMFVALVAKVDWQRILMEAAGCHQARHPDKFSPWVMAPGELEEEGGVCGECMREALLTLDSLTSWMKPSGQ